MRLIDWMGASVGRFTGVLRISALAALAAAGSACSGPRSLVQLDDVDMSQLPLDSLDMSQARLQIDVTDEGGNLHRVSKDLFDLQPDSPGGSHFQIGVFLPSSVSGMVQVVVIVLDKDGCQIGGSNDPVSIIVNAGTTTRQTKTIVIIILPEPTCPNDTGVPPPPPDAGPEAEAMPPADDAGQPGAEVSADAPAPPADAATVDAYCPPDTGVETAPPPTCEQFCGMATNRCPAYYPNLDGCMAACQSWRPGTVPDNAGGTGLGDDTIGCRLYFLLHWTPNMAESFCQAVAPVSTRCAL